MKVTSFQGGINRRLAAHHPDLLKRAQCVTMQNSRYRDGVFEPITGTRRYHGNSIGASEVTALMPYYNDQTDQFILLAACGDQILKKDDEANEFTSLVSALTPGSIFSHTIRHGVMYIASTNDGLKQYTGGNTLDKVGGGSTQAGSFRIIVYMKEIDRLFGISDDAILGQITWCDLSQPEIWDGANVERMKLKDGERVEGADVLYGKLIIFCTYTIWIYYVSGNEENWKLEEAPTSVGCVAPGTIKKDGNRILFLGESPKNQLGVYSFNGSTCELLTDDVSPLLERINKNKLRNACAEIHDDLYTLSFAYGASEENDVSIDLDLLNRKEDGTPAIYGPHTFGFTSSAVLNRRHKNKEWIIGDVGGYVYFENGNTFKSTNGNNGSVIIQDFLSPIHNEQKEDVLKQYKDLSVFFKPTSYFDAVVKYMISYGTFGEEGTFRPAVVSEGFAGEFDVYNKRIYGIPELYEHKEYLGVGAIGTAIQIQITNRVKTRKLSFTGYGYNFNELHQTNRIQQYVA